MDINKIIEFRNILHRHPEPSGKESETAGRIIKELEACHPDTIVSGIGGTGIAAKFAAVDKTEKTILFRAELDAIAVSEETGLDYQSINSGIMHGCGHDGHMAILIGLAQYLSGNRSKHTDVWLLFQPAEETGEGAQQMLDDPRFKEIDADRAYALHNLPGFKENSVVVKSGVFAAASVGIDVKFKGKSSHAAYPDQGINPAAAMAALVKFTGDSFRSFRESDPANKIVTTYMKLGERAFGISPGEGHVGFTIRSSSDAVLKEAAEKLKDKISSMQEGFEGEISFNMVEPFAATVNLKEGVKCVKEASKNVGCDIIEIDEPFPWSEDFGKFRKKFPITLFGLGTGSDHPPLHSELYDFNDSLIETGVRLFQNLIEL